MLKKQPNLSQPFSGFTLIEIIVTVAIIGIVIAFVGVNISRDTDRLARLEAKRFHVVVNEVRDEAIIAGAYYILTVDVRENTYEFAQQGGDADSLRGDTLLQRRGLEPGVKLEWNVFDQITDNDAVQAQVAISPLGEITPFDLGFKGDEQSYHIFVNDENVLEQKIETKN